MIPTEVHILTVNRHATVERVVATLADVGVDVVEVRSGPLAGRGGGIELVAAPRVPVDLPVFEWAAERAGAQLVALRRACGSDRVAAH